MDWQIFVLWEGRITDSFAWDRSPLRIGRGTGFPGPARPLAILEWMDGKARIPLREGVSAEENIWFEGPGGPMQARLAISCAGMRYCLVPSESWSLPGPSVDSLFDVPFLAFNAALYLILLSFGADPDAQILALFGL
jgi:hypothetical protein